MPLTAKDIRQFARSAVEFQHDVFYAKTPEQKAKRLRAHRLAARAYWTRAQEDVQGSGYRVTQRVKDILWVELERIAATEAATSSSKTT